MTLSAEQVLLERINAAFASRGAMSIPETSKFIDASVSKVWELIRTDALPARKLGRRTVVLVADAIVYLNGLPKKQGASQPHRDRALKRWDAQREAQGAEAR